VTALRLPVLAGLSAALNYRLEEIDYFYVPRWAGGWRPWRARAALCLPFELCGLTLLALAPRTVLKAAYHLLAQGWPRLRTVAGRAGLRTEQGATRRSGTGGAARA
jgi:hypothetical protein